MDKIEFKLAYYTYGPDDYSSVVAEIFINDKNFFDIITEFDASLGHHGGYAPVRSYYLYSSLTKEYKEDFVFIYDCICGCDGCNPFCVFIDVGEKVVTWYDFMTSKEYFDDVCEDNNFAMLRERLKNKGGLPPLVFDKEQYFAAVEKLDKSSEKDRLRLEYGGIDCGDIKLIVKADGKIFEFLFDEELNDPLPQLVKLYKAAKNKGWYEIALKDEVLYNPPFLKISIKEWFDEQLRFYVEIVDEGIIFKEYYLREELLAMLEKFFSDLLNDKDFPDFYPCFSYSGDNLPEHKEFLKKYKKMLTKYVVPKGW